MNLYIVVAIVFWSCWSILNKLSLQTLHPAMVQIISAATFAAMVPVYLYLLPKSECRMPPTSGILYALFAAIATSTASIAYMTAAGRGEVSSVLSTTSVYPLLTFFIAVIFLGESFTINKLVGTCCVLTGVWFINK